MEYMGYSTNTLLDHLSQKNVDIKTKINKIKAKMKQVDVEIASKKEDKKKKEK